MAAEKSRKILVAMMDGFGPDYLQASNMPNLKQMIKEGFYKTVSACMPTVTNINNASICTGEYAEVHGITANSYFDLASKKEHTWTKPNSYWPQPSPREPSEPA
jgi:phosphonoacetate hydrolase